MKILIVEDDEALNNGIALSLPEDGLCQAYSIAAESLMMLARTLGCRIEDLMEYGYDVRE